MTEPVLVPSAGGVDRRRLMKLLAVAVVLAAVLLLGPRLLGGGDDGSFEFPATPVPTTTTVAPATDGSAGGPSGNPGRNPFAPG